MRRVMGVNRLLAYPIASGVQPERGRLTNGTIVTDKVNEMWGTDMSQTVTLFEEGPAYVFVAVEHANSEIIGIHAARSAKSLRGAGAGPAGGVSVLRLHRARRGAWAQAASRSWLQLHMSGDFQRQRDQMSGHRSFCQVLRARTRGGNGVAERFIRTLKENLLWVRTFKTIEELRAELVAFARRYNETWLVARHGYKTPARVREEQTMPPIAIDPTVAATLPLAA